MPNDSNNSGIGETCLACKKTIKIAKSLKCTICNERCHMACIKPQVSEEIKAAMVQNKLIQFICPKCSSVVETYKGKINARFMDYAMSLNENTQKMKDAQLDLENQRIKLNDKLKQIQEENNQLKTVSQSNTEARAQYDKKIQELQLQLQNLVKENQQLKTSNIGSASHIEFEAKLQELQIKLNNANAENENLRKIRDGLTRNPKRQQ